jgi:hypothetical protein
MIVRQSDIVSSILIVVDRCLVKGCYLKNVNIYRETRI